MSNSTPEPSLPKSRKTKLIVTPDEASLEGVKLNLNLLTNKEATKSGEILVVMDKHRTTVVLMPGQTKPFHTKSKKHAEMVAKACGGVVEPLRAALRFVASSPCNLPKDSKRYNSDPSAPKISGQYGVG